MPTKKATAKKPMSSEHKAALAEGREQGRAVRAYLEALESNHPKRGRKRTPESIEKRLAVIDGALADADPLKRVQLLQERLDLTDELAKLTDTTDLTMLEAGFVKAAAGYSERKGISYATWREVGVPAATLTAAGIKRSEPFADRPTAACRRAGHRSYERLPAVVPSIRAMKGPR